MFSKSKWISSGLWKPKNPHSLENLKYLYTMLNKNQVVTENNKGMIVETLRSMSEILIWGDQNDSSVFDFFLEKNMLVFFLKFMRQKSGRYICVQLLQTLNILFDNISDETSVYFLLSNNHINSIIVHKFDFSDEEVIAYYISFLKTLSLKLNKHTIHFFYNENTNDFALYTEAIKFFNHSESMVRIAVRTITLNVYKVDDRSMLRYIRDKTAAPYFSNLVWFIGNHILELDSCVRNDADHNSRDRLADLVAEHLDHLHYLNDILCLGIDALNDVLTDHLLNRLLLPLYIYSLTKRKKYTEHLEGERPHIHSVVSLFLLSQVFLILSHKPMVRVLMDIIFNSEYDIFAVEGNNKDSTEKMLNITCSVPGFVKPAEPLADTLESNSGKKKRNKKRLVAKQQTSTSTLQQQPSAATPDKQKQTTQPKTLLSVAEATNSTPASSDATSANPNATVPDAGADSVVNVDASVTENNTSTAVQAESPEKKATKKEEAHSDDVETEKSLQYPSQSQESEYYTSTNVTDEEKLNAAAATTVSSNSSSSSSSNSKPSASSSSLACEDGSQFSLDNRPYFEAIFMALECSENDYEALFALCLLYAMGHNEDGVNQELMDAAFMPTDKSATKHHYNTALIEKLIAIIRHSCENGSKVRLATLEMSVLLLKQLVYKAPAAPTVGVGVGGSAGSGPSTPTRTQNQGAGAAGVSYLQDQHLAAIEAAYEEAALLLRNFYKVWEKSEEIFLDMFQDEYNEMKTRPLNVECLMMDASILLPPTGTPLTGIQFNKRLPCGEVERARRAIRVFFHIRELSLTLRNEPETQLPLTKQEECVSVDDVLDLNNSDLIGCTVITKDGQKDRRFLVIDVLQLILVKPDSRRLGWGVVKFVGFLQDVEVTGDKDDSRSLHVTIHKPTMNSHARPQPLLCAKFVLDDHIRCMAAKQRLTKGRLKARQRKMQMIARLLQLQDYYPSSHSQQAAAHSAAHGAASAAANAAAAVAAASASTGSAVPGGSAVLNKPSPTAGIGGGTGVTMRGSTPGATASTTVIQNQAAPMRGIPGRSHPLKPMRAEVSRNLRIDQNAADQSSDSLVSSRVRTASQAAKASTASSSRVSQPQNRNIQQLAQKQIPQQSNNANSNVNSTNAANVGNKASTDGGVQTKAVGDTDDQSVPATPEAHAVMSLNQPLIAAQSTNNGTANVHRSGSSSSRTSSLDRSSSPVQEIPLEDLSVSRHNHITSRSRSRSSSYSPGRFRRLSAGHKQNSTTGNGGEQERNSRPQARSNSKSDQSDVLSSPSSSHNAKCGDVVTSNNSSSSRSRSANIGLTSFTTDPHKDNDSSSLDEFASNDATLADNDDMDSDGKLSNHGNTSATPSSSSSATTSQGPQQQQEQRRRRTSSSSSSASAGMSQSSCPKSLIPPEEPVVSLIIDDSSSEQCDLSHVTPRLVPVGDATTSSPSSMHPHLSVLSSSVVIQPAASSNSDAISEADITAGSNR